MSCRQSGTFCLLAVLAVCLTGIVSISCAAKFAGHQVDTTVKFGEGELVPDLTGPFMYRSMITKIGEPDKNAAKYKIESFRPHWELIQKSAA